MNEAKPLTVKQRLLSVHDVFETAWGCNDSDEYRKDLRSYELTFRAGEADLAKAKAERDDLEALADWLLDGKTSALVEVLVGHALTAPEDEGIWRALDRLVRKRQAELAAEVPEEGDVSNKHRTLDDYPCPVGLFKIPDPYRMCNAECRATIDSHDDEDCRWETCRFLDVYRKAIADNKCARLLRVFEKRYFGKLLDWLYFADLHDSRGRAERFGERMELWRETFRDALRAAGLE